MYLSFVLSATSRQDIMEELQEIGLMDDDYDTDDGINDIYCNHITLFFDPKFEDMQRLLDLYSGDITVIANDVFANGDACCIRCSINGEYMSLDGREFHVTIWCRKYLKPVYSNTLLEEEGPCAVLNNKGIELFGQVKLVN